MEEKNIIITGILMLALMMSIVVYSHKNDIVPECWKEQKVFLSQDIVTYLFETDTMFCNACLSMTFTDKDSMILPDTYRTKEIYYFQTEHNLNPDMEEEKVYDITWCNISDQKVIRKIE